MSDSEKGFARKKGETVGGRKRSVKKRSAKKPSGIELHGGDRVAKIISSRKRKKLKTAWGISALTSLIYFNLSFRLVGSLPPHFFLISKVHLPFLFSPPPPPFVISDMGRPPLARRLPCRQPTGVPSFHLSLPNVSLCRYLIAEVQCSVR